MVLALSAWAWHTVGSECSEQPSPLHQPLGLCHNPVHVFYGLMAPYSTLQPLNIYGVPPGAVLGPGLAG